MGTTMTYIQLKNRGFTRDELQAGMNTLFGGKQREQRSLGELERRMSAMKAAALSTKDLAVLKLLRGAMEQEEKGPQVGFRADAPWLPLWNTELCDGAIRSSKDLNRLSEAFQTPVLALALFDSDVLFVSYRDNATGEAYDYAKPNYEEYDEYDSETYRTQFPEFLTELCPPDSRPRLEEIWSAEEDFADDRMYNLLELLGAVVLDPEAEHDPEGFELIGPN